MATPSSQMTMLNKLLELLMSPQISESSGGFDPRTLVDEEDDPASRPLAQTYMNSENEDIARVFSGLVAGRLDPLTAKSELAGLADAGVFGSLQTGPLFSAVDQVVKEANTVSAGKKKKSAAREAGLPDPLESYMDIPEFAPMGEKTQRGMSEAGELEKLYAASLNAASRPKRGSTKGSARGGEGVPDYIARSLANMSPEYLEGAKQDLAKSGKYQKQVKADYLTGNAARLDQAGRTPYKDALGKNAVLLKALFGK